MEDLLRDDDSRVAAGEVVVHFAPLPSSELSDGLPSSDLSDGTLGDCDGNDNSFVCGCVLDESLAPFWADRRSLGILGLSSKTPTLSG